MTTEELKAKLLNLKMDLEYFENKCSALDYNDLEFLRSQVYFEIQKTYEELAEKLQETCTHDVWYLLRQDRSFNIVSDTCRCVQCGMIRTRQEDKFKEKLIGNNKSRFAFKEEDKYNNIRNEYDTYVNMYGKEDSVKRVLQKYKY